jgi:hypothetical protein
MLCGASLTYLKKKKSDEPSPGDTPEVAASPNTADVGLTDSWSAVQDPLLISIAKQLFVHITRLLHVLMHVIEETNPLAGLKVSQFFYRYR